MKFIINETCAEMELHFYRPNTAEDLADELIGNSGAIGDYITPIPGDTVYSISADDFRWWSEYMDMASKREDQLDSLREHFGAGEVDDIIAAQGLYLGPDYTQHAQEYADMVQAILAAFGVDEEAVSDE